MPPSETRKHAAHSERSMESLETPPPAMKTTAQTPGNRRMMPKITIRTVRTGWRPMVRSSWAICLSLRPRRRQRSTNAVDAAVAVEQVVGVERDNLSVRGHEVDAGALDPADAEIEAIHELHDGDAEHVLVAQTLWHRHLRQAAQKFREPLGRVVGAR